MLCAKHWRKKKRSTGEEKTKKETTKMWKQCGNDGCYVYKLEKRKEWHEPQKKSGERKKKNVEAMW